MRQSMEAYYDRKMGTFLEIVLSADRDRNPAMMLGRTSGSSLLMEEIALAPKIFQTLPATNPTLNWPTALPGLYKRVNELRPLALWAEPFDESFTFQDSAYKFIEQAAEQVKQSPEKAEAFRLAYVTLLSMVLNSGSYDRIVSLSPDNLPDIAGTSRLHYLPG